MDTQKDEYMQLLTQIKETSEYAAISRHYAKNVAMRSKVPLINHIDEGVCIIENLGGVLPDGRAFDQKYAAKAFCIHPLFQDDKALLDVGMTYAHVAPSAVPVVLAMEYRVHANSWLSDKVWVDAFLETKQTRGPSAGDIPEVWAMLIADKVQNYKDFLAYHNGSHPRTVELNYYFKAWLKYLKVDNYEQYL